ncbi:LysE family transporter [Allostreptomyces psammosilenae]|uniref:Chemosensory pili system protein ChpE n=1 Tax=Allostreptomyces psammosilenae TaxID=1892865 RepID=A0A853A002_9ACTN|nr:LysE family transporter [Allostreptomyces psammosilenae]NYI03708.1 chemosensory pili system protein ChpE [Allostreptomyces psammosilenae]
MTEIFMVALWLGLVFNAAPGAVFSESLRRGIRGGFGPALAVQVGSLVGDAVWAVLGLAGAGALFAVPALRVPLTVAGCLLLAWLGVTGLRDALARKGPDPTAAEPHGGQDRGAMAVGAGMSLANPWNVVYWSGAAGGVGAVLGGARAGTAELAVFFAGFMASSLLWCVISAGLIVVLRRALPPVAVRVLEACCGVSLLVFALLQLCRLG